MSIFCKLIHKKAFTFAVGAAAGLIIPPIVKSKTARKAAVNITAQGMKLKDDAKCAFETIKEDAEDIYEEAKETAKAKE